MSVHPTRGEVPPSPNLHEVVAIEGGTGKAGDGGVTESKRTDAVGTSSRRLRQRRMQHNSSESTAVSMATPALNNKDRHAHSMTVRILERFLPLGVVHAWLRSKHLKEMSDVEAEAQASSLRDNEFSRLWSAMDVNGNGYLENAEWEDSLYVIYAYSPVRVSNTRHVSLRGLLAELYSRWEAEDGWDVDSSPVSRERFRQMYHTVRKGWLLPRNAVVSTDADKVGHVPIPPNSMPVDEELTEDLFKFTDRALGLHKHRETSKLLEALRSFAIILVPFIAYPVMTYTDESALSCSLHRWMSAPPQQLSKNLTRIKRNVLLRSLGVCVMWLLCIAPTALRMFLEVDMALSWYEMIMPVCAFAAYFFLTRVSVAHRVPWISIRRKKREVESLSCRVVRFSTNEDEMLPMWTVMRGSYCRTGGLGFHRHLLVPMAPRKQLLQSHAVFMFLAVAHALLPTVYRVWVDGASLEPIDWPFAIFFALGSLVLGVPFALDLSQLTIEFWNFLFSMQRLRAISTRNKAQRIGLPVYFDMTHVYSVFAWFRMRSFAIARLSAPIDQKQVLFGLLLLVSVGLSAIVFAQIILLKISVTSLNVLMELTFLIILSVFLLQVITVGGMANIEKQKHFRVLQLIALRLIPHKGQRIQRLDFKDDFEGDGTDRMDQGNVCGATSLLEEVDVVEVLRGLRDILRLQDPPLSVLGLALSQQLLTSIATVLGSLAVSVISSLMPT